MRKVFTILIPALFQVQFSMAQPPAIAVLKPVSYNRLITAGPSLPLAQFGETHWAGITAIYIRKKERFNQQVPYNRKKTGWITAASFSHFAGKKERINQSAFRYSHYSLLSLQGGIAWYALPKINFLLHAGPGLGYYNQSFRFSVTGQLQGTYLVGPKTIITPGCALIKQPGSDALWFTSLQLGILF